ncbi:MAG TPA: hypothetical protein VLK25_08740 [Allosphingosinicella sp.]|nr:hypothetical protein [Allosphingosinicella sp.]
MNGDYEPVDSYGAAARRRSPLRPLLVPGLAFLLGLGAMGYLLANWDAAARAIGIAPAAPAQSAPQRAADAAPPPQVQPAAEIDADGPPDAIVIDPEIARRVAALEQRLGQVGTEARAAVGNADRAEGLLVAFAARRALDRGVPLGFLEALLNQRFGATQPRAVGMIILAARNPVTLQELQLGLQDAGPRLAGPPPDASWWDTIGAELGSLVTIRREGTPSTQPSERLARAQQRLEAGQVEVSLAEVMRIPGHDNAGDWVRKARIYVAARRALDTIETAALLEPRAAQAPAPQPAQARTQPQPRQPAPAQPARRQR